MNFMFGLCDELEKLAGEEGSTMYGHGDGEKKPSALKGMATGAVAGGAAHAAVAEGLRRSKRMPFDLADKARSAAGGALHGKPGAAAEGKRALELLRTGGKAGPWHGAMAKHLPLAVLAGGLGGASIQAMRRGMHHGEKKEAGAFGGLRKMVAKVPKKAVGGAALAAGGYAVGKHRGLKKGEGEAMQVGEKAYEAGAEDMEGAIMSQLGISS